MDGLSRKMALVLAGSVVVAATVVATRSQGQSQQLKQGTQSAAQPANPNQDRIFLSPQDKRAIPLVNGETRIVASLLSVTGSMRYGAFVWDETGVPAGAVWIRVDLRGQTISVFRGEHEIGTGVILFGADSHPTPVGRFPVMAKYKDHRSSIYDAMMPYTLRLTGDGISIHGSNVRQGLATHGCIGIPSAFAARIFEAVKVKDPVYIVNAV